MSDKDSARHLLRTATGDLHAELDALLSRADFNDRTSYADFLARQAAPLFAIEDAIEAGGLAQDLPDWPQRRRADAIRADLARLGAAVPAASGMPPLTGADRLFGALYVLEGSRLGAKFLVRGANASRDEAVRDATAYLSHGEGKAFWPTFLTALASREVLGLDHEALVEGSRAAFAAFLAEARRPVARSEADVAAG